MTSFKLAPMDGLLRAFTWLLMPLPVVLGAVAFSAPRPAGLILLGTALFTVIIYASVWLFFRPLRFEVTETTLRIVWPTRSRDIPLSAISSASWIEGSEFRRKFGYGMRVGAGGLWGGFGRLVTSHRTFELWISRRDWFVVVERNDGGRPLLLTPTEPERFCALLTAQRY